MIVEMATLIFAIFLLAVGVVAVVAIRRRLSRQALERSRQDLPAQIARLERELDKDQAQDREAL